MKYHIQESEKTPAYLQLYHQLRNDIINGVYPRGTKLPSKRILAKECGVSVITSEHAYSILCDEGYIEARERSGYFVIYRETDFLSVGDPFSSAPTHVTSHHNVDTEFPFTVLAKTMRKILLDYGDDILIKSPNQGCHELQKSLSSYLARSNGIMVKPEQIIIGSGAEYLYNLIVQLLGKERIYALEDPCYDKIQKVYRACDVQYDMLKLGHDGIQTGALERTTASVLHVTPFHSYPSNVTASASKKKEYIQWATKRSGIIIEDNYDSELTISRKAEDPIFSLAPEGTVIYLNTFSKTIAPSIRVGYMVLPENLLTEFKQKLGFYSCTVPIFEQYVLAELINNGNFERHINRIRRTRRKAKESKNASGYIQK